MKKKNITIALIGLGGYGNHYLNLIFKTNNLHNIDLVAGIDPNPVACNHLDDMKKAGIPIFPNIEDFYKKMTADLVIISTPIHLHAPMTSQVLSHGSHVLCEKPLAATMDDAQSMLHAEQQSDQQVAIGYQWSYSPAIIRLKQDILKGRFGKAKKMKTITLWPRKNSYYQRAPWSGKIKLDDTFVMDSPVSNATAHYLHNMLYLLGTEEHLAAIPKSIQAETYRAKEIENFDTAMLRCITEKNEEILFYTTHACQTVIGPMFSFEFEKATVIYATRAVDNIIAHFNDGSKEEYGSPNAAPESKITLTADAIINKTKFRCGIDAASRHLKIVNVIQQTAEKIQKFPQEIITTTKINDDDSLVHVNGLEETMLQCYTTGLLPSEYGNIPWSKKAEKIML